MVWLLTLALADPPVAPLVHFPFDGTLVDVGGRGIEAQEGDETDCGFVGTFSAQAGEAYACDLWDERYEQVSGPDLYPTTSFTVSAWVLPGQRCFEDGTCVVLAQGNTNNMNEKGADEPFGFMFFVQPDDPVVEGMARLCLEVQFSDGPWSQQANCLDDVVQEGEWTWVAAVYDESTAEFRFYLDGVLLDTRGVGPVGPDWQLGLSVGHIADRDNSYAGAMDEVMLFDGALSDEDVQAMWEWYEGADGCPLDGDCDTGTTGTTGTTGDTGKTGQTGHTGSGSSHTGEATAGTGHSGGDTGGDTGTTADTGDEDDTGSDTGAADTGADTDTGDDTGDTGRGPTATSGDTAGAGVTGHSGSATDTATPGDTTAVTETGEADGPTASAEAGCRCAGAEFSSPVVGWLRRR